tara:strand:+ start:84 stop:1418 length:1335 start_codon:yes stop_codon:yes gene_type:complete
VDYLDRLSRFVVDTCCDDLSEEAIIAVRNVTLDTVGAIIAGSHESENADFAQIMSKRSGPGTATILGHGLRAEPMMATLVNSTAGVALEMDEGNRFGGGHPAIHTLPGALAVAEEMGASGRSFIEAVLVGYEVESRIGGATKARDNVHSHGHWGAVGTAAAVAKLRGHSANDVRSIINLAASMSPANTWTTAFKGATIRNLYPGRSGFHGILADHLHACGFTGLDDAPSDVFGTIIGESFDTDAVVNGLGGEYRIQQNYFKLHACCRYNHPVLDAVMQATASSDFQTDEVEAVDVSVPSMLQGMLGEYPENMLAAKFNVPYAVAAALVHRRTDITVFRPQVIGEQDVRSIADRVNVSIDPTLAMSGAIPLTTATIRLKDGQRLSAETRLVRGDYGNRIPQDELVEKFSFLTDEILGHVCAEDVISAVSDLENLNDIRALTEILG